MKAPLQTLGSRDGKSSVSPTTALGLIVVVLASAAILATWKPWDRTADVSSSALPADSPTQGTATVTATNVAGASNDLVTLMNEGTELVARGDTEGAIQKYRAAMKLNPEDEEVYFNMAFAYARQGNTNQAIHYYNEALRIFPDYAEAHNNLGNLLVGLRQHTNALEHFTAALKVNPESSSALNNYGRCLAELGRPKEAVAQFSEAIRVNPDYLEARFNLATTYSILEEYDEAIRQFEELLKKEPGFVLAQKGIERAKAKQTAKQQP